MKAATHLQHLMWGLECLGPASYLNFTPPARSKQLCAARHIFCSAKDGETKLPRVGANVSGGQRLALGNRGTATNEGTFSHGESPLV